MKLASIPGIIIAAIGLSTGAFAQRFNIDAGTANAVPSAGFGAATGQSGSWNQADCFLATPQALINTAGGPTATTLTISGTNLNYSFNNANTSGDDELLMDDLQDLSGGGATTWTIGPLAAGFYRVTVYAWAPDVRTDKTSVTINGGSLGAQVCGGAVPNVWPGFVLGQTHVQDIVAVGAGGSISFTADGNTVADFGNCNGAQVERLGQRFNIDAGTANAAPSAAFGAATGQAGTWNRADCFLPTPQALVDTAGVATTTTLTISGSNSNYAFNNANTSGNDELLMDDLQDLSGAGATTWTIGPLAAGTYRVTVYAWAPDVRTDKTSVTIIGGALGAQVCGGAAPSVWPGFVLGQTHVQDIVAVGAGGSISFTADGNTGADFGNCNGAQVELLGQRFNIDSGTVNAAPSAAFGAATGQTGSWNQADCNLATPQALVDTAGVATATTLTISGTNFNYWFNNANTSGDDELLMDDLQDLSGTGATTWTIGPLAAGTYLVTVYAWAPDVRTDKTSVTINGGSLGAQVCGGVIPNVWPGFVLGQTHVQDTVVVGAGGSISFTADGNTVADFGNCNGAQIELAPAPPTNFCTAGTTSNGCVPSLGTNSNPSVSAANPCFFTATNVEGQKSGIVFYSIDNNMFAPLQWGTGTSFLCVKPPTQRMDVQSSGGTLNACDGVMTQDFNAWRTTHAIALGTPYLAGQRLYLQGWFRDPPAPKTTNLTNGLTVTFIP